MFALKLSRAAGARVILSSSSDEKLAKIKERYPSPLILTVNYNKTPNWDEEVMRLTNGHGVDFVVENGGAPSLVRSIKCTRRGGVVSQVGYLGKQDPSHLSELVPTIIDRRVTLRYVTLDDAQDYFMTETYEYIGASMLAQSTTWKTSARPCHPIRHNLMILLIKCFHLMRPRRRYSSSGRVSRLGKSCFACRKQGISVSLFPTGFSPCAHSFL